MRSIRMKIHELFIDSFMLAPGGKHFIFQTEDGYIYLYDTQSQLKLCTHGRRATYANETIQCMDCAIIDEETALILVVLIRQKFGIQQ